MAVRPLPIKSSLQVWVSGLGCPLLVPLSVGSCGNIWQIILTVWHHFSKSFHCWSFFVNQYFQIVVCGCWKFHCESLRPHQHEVGFWTFGAWLAFAASWLSHSRPIPNTHWPGFAEMCLGGNRHLDWTYWTICLVPCRATACFIVEAEHTKSLALGVTDFARANHKQWPNIRMIEIDIYFQLGIKIILWCLKSSNPLNLSGNLGPLILGHGYSFITVGEYSRTHGEDMKVS